MNEYITTKGIVLKTTNLGEYDRRMVVLTEDRGKITVFGRGVRRMNNKHLAACSPFSFGQLKAFPGRDAYSLLEFSVNNYFEGLRTDFEISCMGMYFLELADYYTRENNDELMMLKLLYVSLRILEKRAKGECELPLELIRYIYEIKSIAVNGEFPGVPDNMKLSEAAAYAVNYIASINMEKLYSFNVTPEVLFELSGAAGYYRGRFLTGNFKSLELI